jgi:hypothetical protein
MMARTRRTSSRSHSRRRGSFWTEEQHRPPLNARYQSLRPLIPPRSPRGPPFPELRVPKTRNRIKYSTTHAPRLTRSGPGALVTCLGGRA